MIPAFFKDQWAKKLRFDPDHFHIFDEKGVIRINRGARTQRVTWQSSNRETVFHPDVGAIVGVLDSVLLTSIQIRAIGIVIQRTGPKRKHVYDIFPLASDPKKFNLGPFGWELIDRDVSAETICPILKNIDGSQIVSIKGGGLKDSYRDQYFTQELRAQYGEIKRSFEIAQEREQQERKERLKRSRSEKRKEKGSKKQRTSPETATPQDEPKKECENV